MRSQAVVAASLLGLFVSGCTATSPRSEQPASDAPAAGPAPALRLAAYGSCDELLAGLRKATQEAVGPWGFNNLPGGIRTLNGGAVPEAQSAASAKSIEDSQYSGTNNHEAGVDEPDRIKTDGKRIVTLTPDGRLIVVDAASRKVTGSLGLTDSGRRAMPATQLLLSGDRALVLGADYTDPERGGPLLTLVDLAGAPKVAGTYRIDGAIVDARQIGSVARVVIRSAPRIAFPDPMAQQSRAEDKRLADNRVAVATAPISAWLPRWMSADAAGKTTEGQVGCDAVSLPDEYSGTSLLTIATFDLAAPALGSGDPVTIAADGDTVYANGPSLYVGNDQRWRSVGPLARRAGGAAVAVPPNTELYKFALAGAAKPRYVAAGKVPGWLLNQYSLSEWDGRLRVATTGADNASSVYLLQERGGALAETGRIGGLGRGERIYSVRFIGTAGYVVTFRQTDPLYALDLSDPAAPKAVGELKITGYSAYLHPAGDGRLLGIGQEANAQGRVQGLQVSLFDVHDLARPARLAQFQVPGAGSAAEFDPHAFLFWAPAGLLVVPVQRADQSAALVLSVRDQTLTQAGEIKQPTPIERSLIIGGTLWTQSASGLQANDASTLAQQAFLPF